MATATSPKLIPVHLYNGRREIPAGNIKIHSDLHFKQFQFNLSQLLGISYNNLTTYLIDTHNLRRILITGRCNFGVLLSEVKTNCYFLVVLKRSRRDRRKKLSENSSPAVYGYGYENFPAIKDVYGCNDNNRLKVKCEECLVGVRENKVPEFHCCVYDEVFFGYFRSPYGPIGRKRTVRF